MSDFLSKMRGLFIVQNPAQEPVVAPVAPAVAQNNTPPVQLLVGAIGKATDQYLDILLGAMEQNNPTGFDYLEFRKSLQTMRTMPMDERTRYFSAFAAAQAMGVSSEKLLQSADFYAGILEAEQKRFEEAHQKQRQQKVGNRETQLQDLDASLKAKAEQIAQLTAQMQAHELQMQQLQTEIVEATQKLESTRNDFMASYHELISQINADVVNMKQFLK